MGATSVVGHFRSTSVRSVFFYMYKCGETHFSSEGGEPVPRASVYYLSMLKHMP
jgi:hypothetical protein